MTATTVGIITFLCTFGSALLATHIRGRLPTPHLSKESQDVVRLGMGLVATMTALLLGLVTAAARSTFDGHDATLRATAVNVLALDRHLAKLGPEVTRTRDGVKQVVTFRVESTWPTADDTGSGFGAVLPVQIVDDLETQIVSFSPDTEAQRWSKAEALRLSQDLLKARWRLLSTSGAIPPAFVGVVIFWLTVTFASFGLYAPRNATVISVLLVAALSVAAAVFLVLELDGPFDGLIKVSAEPLRFALANLGH